MDRRTFLKTTTAAAAATTATAGAALGNEAEQASFAAPPFVETRHEFLLRLPMQAHLRDAVEQLARDINIASSGRIVLHIVSEAGQIHGSYGQLSEYSPALSLFTGLPGDMAVAPADLLAWHSCAGGELFLDEATHRLGIKAIIAGHSGPQLGLWSEREIVDLRDFSAAELDTFGLGCSVASYLQQTTNGAESAADALRLQEVSAQPLLAFAELPQSCRRIWYRDGLHDQGQAHVLVLNRNDWESLSSGEQLLVQTVANLAAHRALAVARTSMRMMAGNVFDNLPTIRKPLPVDVAEAIRFTAVKVTHEAVAGNAQIERAFNAYSAYFEATMGLPLPRLSARASFTS